MQVRRTCAGAQAAAVVLALMTVGLVLPAQASPSAGTPSTQQAVAELATASAPSPASADRRVSTYLVDTSGAKAADRLAKRVQGDGGTVVHRYTRVLQGFAATMTARQAKRLRDARGVLAVEKDRTVVAAACPGCLPQALTREHVANWGLLRLSSRSAVTLDQEPPAPRYVSDSDGEGVTVFVVDSRVDPDQAELEGRVRPGRDFVGGTSAASSCSAHGTSVGQVVGGSRSGVAEAVRLVPLRVLDCADEGAWSDVVAALDWAVEHRPDGPAAVSLGASGPRFRLGDKAVRATMRAGLPVVVPAGNDHADACRRSPARVGAVVTVASSTIEDRRAPSSNRGRCVDLFAAGQDVATTTGSVSGTSYAAAHVVGAVARYLENHPRATPAEVSAWLTRTATKGAVRGTRGAPDRLLYVPPPVAPGAPRDVRATVDDGANTVTATWREPATTGSAPLRSYSVCLIDRTGAVPTPAVRCTTVPASVRTATLGTRGDGTTIADGDVYELRVAAVSKAGSGSDRVEVRFAHVLPTAPYVGAVVDEEAFGLLLWVSAPPQDPAVGPITGWQVTLDDDGDGEPEVSFVVEPRSSPYNYVTFGGAERGKTYTLTAALVTAYGTGPAATTRVTYPG